MIKILKEGKIQKLTKTIYEATCQCCGCIFEFETEDIKLREKCIDGDVIVECPCCHLDIIQSIFKYRIEEVEEE